MLVAASPPTEGLAYVGYKQATVRVILLPHTFPQSVNSGPDCTMHHTRLSPVLWISLIALALLTGCGRVDSEQDAGAQIAAELETPTVIPSTLPITTPVGTATLLPREQKATEIARFENEQATVSAHSTSFALGTPYPTSRPFTPRPRRPAITPVPGINTDCADADREFSFVNCWNELIGDQYVFADTVTLKADPLRAVLHVYTATLNLDDISPIQSYPTSTRVGRVRISSVSWPLMTLTTLQTDPPITFVFNLETRQWISPPLTPGPSPSALVSPVPSGTPVPTQSP
jgi:hypothetical protein